MPTLRAWVVIHCCQVCSQALSPSCCVSFRINVDVSFCAVFPDGRSRYRMFGAFANSETLGSFGERHRHVVLIQRCQSFLTALGRWMMTSSRQPTSPMPCHWRCNGYLAYRFPSMCF